MTDRCVIPCFTLPTALIHYFGERDGYQSKIVAVLKFVKLHLLQLLNLARSSPFLQFCMSAIRGNH